MVTNTSFISNCALSSGFICLVRLLVLNSSAYSDGRIAVDSEHGGNSSFVNVSANSVAEYTRGLRFDHVSGLLDRNRATASSTSRSHR
jgi:hypothetical protein